jgi:hypothetical protein
MIAKLEAKCFSVKHAADITSAISGSGRNVVRYTLIADNTADLADLITQVVSTASPPELPRRPHNSPCLPGPPKPLYSENDIDLARLNPAVAQMMRNANQELRQFDMAAVNAKEAARLNRLKQKSASQSVVGSVGPSEYSQSVTGSVAPSEYSQSVAGSVVASVYSQDIPNTQRTDRELMPPPPPPVKRGRGRPRKTTRPSSVGPSEQVDSQPESSVNAQTQPESSADGAPVRRGRGRPRGSKNRPKESTNLMESSPDTESLPESSADATSVRRGRGRPRGSKNRPKQPSQSHSTEHSLTRSETPAERQPPATADEA